MQHYLRKFGAHGVTIKGDPGEGDLGYQLPTDESEDVGIQQLNDVVHYSPHRLRHAESLRIVHQENLEL